MPKFWSLPKSDKLDFHWLFIWSLIYLSFLLLDLFRPHFQGSMLIKYAGIFLCTVYAYQKYRQDNNLILALFSTFLADTILVWTPYEALGVFIFCFAQFLHTMRLWSLGPAALKFYSASLIVFSLFLIKVVGISLLYAIAGIYALELCLNLLLALRQYRLKPLSFAARCACFGFLLFFACDFCVGLRHLMLDGVLSAHMLPLVAFLVWVFYLPSQVLLAASSNLAPREAASKNV